MSDHILVVDDDELVRSGLAMNLKHEGFQVSTASSGEEALEFLSKKTADLVLCDIVMGGMDGLETLKRIHVRWPEIPVVMITGQGSVNSALEALKSGASDYLQKPAAPREVIHRIQSLLDSIHMKRTLLAERQKAEERKKEMQEHLIRAERMVSLGMLAEGASHDLNNILGPLIGYPLRIRQLIPENEEVLKYVKSIEESAHKAAAIIHDLQAIGRGAHFEKVSLNVNAVVEQFMRSADYQKIKATYPKVQTEVRLGKISSIISGSSSQLYKVVTNLVLNAYESMPDGGAVEISTTSKYVDRAVGRYGYSHPGEYVIISVKDAGKVLRHEDIERIFEPFYTRKKMGRRLLSGLGMTMVFRVVEDHGGFIDISTSADKGNVFHLYLPVAKTEGQETLELRPDYTGDESILIVDDYQEQRDTAAELLRGLGYQVITAENGHAAIRQLENAIKDGSKIDLIILDLVLGDEFDGVETYKKIIEITPEQKAILMSGFSDINRIVEARKLGITQCLQKPYSLDTLGRAIRQELDAEN